jgi:hypothetical protein
MVCLLKFRIADVGFAVLAPVFWLLKWSAYVQSRYRIGYSPWTSSILTSLRSSDNGCHLPREFDYAVQSP